MKKSILILFFFVLKTSVGFSQTKAIVIDSITSKTIPYVNIWVENENNGTTSNDYGEFIINETDSTKNIVFSAIGYKRETVQISQRKNKIYLKPETTVLEEVLITKKKESKKIVIDKFKKKDSKSWISTNGTPWMLAKYFKFKEEYQETPYIKQISILTKSKNNDSKFNIRLYLKDNNGFPKKAFYNKNIIGYAKKGKHITTIDVSDLNLEFPKDGLFISVEWLIIEDNKYNFSFTYEGEKKINHSFLYNPKIGLTPTIDSTTTKRYFNGKWYKPFKNKDEGFKNFDNKYMLPSISLTLTN